MPQQVTPTVVRAAAWVVEVGFREVAEAMAMVVKRAEEAEVMWEMEMEAAGVTDCPGSLQVATRATGEKATVEAEVDSACKSS